MSLFDYFVPKPPIECPFCGAPTKGWQGKPWGGCALFVWEQGHLSPVEQRVDDECRISAEQLATRRLERDLIPIYGGECLSCGCVWFDSALSVSADARDGMWTGVVFNPPPLRAAEITQEILQCSGCAEPVDVQPTQSLAYCATCRRLISRPSPPIDISDRQP